jgi:hypothetical protein
MKEKDGLSEHFKCDDVGELEDYVGCKIDIDRKEKKMTISQPVLVQSLFDEFGDIPQGRMVLTPAPPGQVLMKGDKTTLLDTAKHKRYRSGVGKLMYLAKHTRPDISNAVRDLARHMHAPNEVHWKSMEHCIRYVRYTRSRCLVIKPSGAWDGKDKSFKFKIRGRSDSNYATDKETRRSITGSVVYLNDAIVMFQSSTQKHVTLSVTEAELAALVSCVQDMLYVYRIIISLELQVELPMVVELDNSGARDLANSWSVGGRTRHVDTRQFFIRDLKEQGLLVFKHISGQENEADIFTKNTDALTLHKHTAKMCGKDNLYETLNDQNN